MRKSHGLFVPYEQHLIVDLEALFKYLHLVIFGYRECIHCGTERATVQAVQQHMTGKGHCTFDISEPDSEFAEFYDFSEPELQNDGDSHYGGETKMTTTSSKPKFVPADVDSIRLPSGKIISRQYSTQTGPSFTQLRRRTRTSSPSQLEYSHSSERDHGANSVVDTNIRDTRLVPSKKERRERAAVTYQLTSMSLNDRNSLMHLSTSQQHSMLSTQHRQAEKVQKEEKRRQSKIDRKGNKNLYAYYHTETPVYQCG